MATVNETTRGGGDPGTDDGTAREPPVAANGKIETLVGPEVVKVAVSVEGTTR